MRKRKGNGIRLCAWVLALILTITSAGIPSVTVEAAKAVKVKKVQIISPKKHSISLNKGKTLKLKVKVTPKNAKNKKVTYKSSNKKIVKILSGGRIKGVKNGTARVTVTAKDGSRKKAVLKVRVVTPVSKVKLNLSSAVIKVGESTSLKATVTPSGASNKKVNWSSSNSKVAAVTKQGVVRGVAAGEVRITAAAADGSKKTASCLVTVKSVTDSGQNPTEPNKPDNPNNPDQPDNPDDPDKPDNPDNPDNPDDPDKPDNPDDPDKPDDPDNPDNPDKPDNPDDPDKPTPVVITLKKIEITTLPTKLTYEEGEVFNPEGMTVTATYSDGTTKLVADFVCYEGELDPRHQSVEVSYTEKGITRKTEVDITVTANDQLVSLSYELKKTALEREGSCFTDDDIKVLAAFKSGRTEVISITDCKVNPQVFTLATTSATVAYTYGNIRKIVKVEGFTVKPYRERYTFENADTMGTIVKRVNETADGVPTEDNAGEIEPKFVQGLAGSALKMDGTYGLRLDKIAGTSSKSYSISMWVKPDSLKDNQALLISTANQFGLQSGLPQTWCAVAGSNATGGIKLWSYNNGYATVVQSQISVGAAAAWSHIVLVVDGNDTPAGTALGTLYVNGRKAGSGNVRNEKNADMKTYLGVTGWKNDGYYAGLVDELIFTNEVLTQEEVEGYYLEYFAEKADKITEVTADKTEISVEYGTTTADVVKALKQITFTGRSGESQIVLENTDAIWTLADHTEATEGVVMAVAKIPAPEGCVFETDGQMSMWETISVSVSVKEKGTLSAIRIDAQPDKLSYLANEKFDRSGMIVKAVYSNGGELDVTKLVQITGEDRILTKEDTSITVIYSEEGVEKSQEVAITVKTAEDIMNEIGHKRTAYYQFDDSLTDTVSSQGATIVKNKPVAAGENAADTEAAPEYVEGISGNAIRFSGDGTHNGLRLDTSITSADYTVSMWLKPEAQIAEFAGAFYAWKDDKNYLSWYSQFNHGFVGMAVGNNRKDTKQAANMFTPGEWKMVTWVMNGNTGKIYLNGELVETATQHANFFTANANAEIYLGSGCFWDNSFNGAWDEVSIFNDALTDQQVKGLYMGIEREQ